MKRRSGSQGVIGKVRPDDILAEHTPEVRALTERLRKLILQAIPTAIETAYPVWHGIGYRHPDIGYFCGIFPKKDIVQLGFEFGVLLPDPDGLLDSTGKQVRYVTIRGSKDIRPKAIKELLQAATSLPQEREAKLWLVRSLSDPSQEHP